MKSKKILFFTSLFPNPESPGRGQFNISRAKALSKLGWEVKVISPVGFTPPGRYLFPKLQIPKLYNYIKTLKKIPASSVYDNIEVFYPGWWWLPRNLFWEYEANLLHIFIKHEVEKVISEFKPDIILASWLNPFGTYSKYLKKYKIPFILIPEGTDILIYPKKYRGIKQIMKDVNENIDAVIYVSSNLKKEASKYFVCSKSLLLHNGYNEEIFNYNETYGNTQLPVRLITVGSHNHVKGYDLLLKAILKLNYNFHLTMCGEGELTNEYRRFAVLNNVEDKITFAGQVTQNEIRSLLAENDYFCHPSRSEGFPSAPLEAMACGLPVIASRVGGLPEVIKDNFNGLLFEPESVDSIYDAINKANNVKWNRKAIADWTKENYGWNKWANKFTEFYYDKYKTRNNKLSEEKLVLIQNT